MNTETLGKLADACEDACVRARDGLDAGKLSQPEYEAVLLVVILGAKAQGVRLADLGLSAELSRLWARIVPPLGLALPDDAEQITREAIEDTLGGDAYAVNAAAALAVLGRSQTLAAAQDAEAEGMVAHKPDGWTRALNGGACELCRDLAGAVLPAEVPMYHHKGCGCSARPVSRDEAEPTALSEFEGYRDRVSRVNVPATPLDATERTTG